MDMIRKVLSFEVKEVAPRVLEFVGSTKDKDRMKDIVEASGWELDNYRKNPVFLWAHHYDMPPVGKAIKAWVENRKLKFHIQFPTREEYEFADTIYKLYKGGYLRATSVGFISLESELIELEEGDEILSHHPTHYLKQELLELSGCPVPANPNALAEAKAKNIISTKEFRECNQQSLRYNTVIWSEGGQESKSAISYQSAHSDGTPKAPDEGVKLVDLTEEEKPYPNEHACRLRAPGDFQDGSFKRTKRQHEGKEYSVIMGKLKDEDTMTEQAYRYDKQAWTAKEASAHCKEHKGTFEPAEEAKKGISQEEIGDELDYLLKTLSGESFNPENTKRLWEIARRILNLRLSGSDIPVDILEKIGAVLNKKNRERLEQIKTLAQEVLDSAEPAESPKPENEKGLSADEIQGIVQQTVSHIIAKAQGKLKI